MKWTDVRLGDVIRLDVASNSRPDVLQESDKLLLCINKNPLQANLLCLEDGLISHQTLNSQHFWVNADEMFHYWVYRNGRLIHAPAPI